MIAKFVLAGALASAASLAQAQEVRVGVDLPYTGVGAELAQQVDRGMEQYLKLNPDEWSPTRSSSSSAT